VTKESSTNEHPALAARFFFHSSRNSDSFLSAPSVPMRRQPQTSDCTQWSTHSDDLPTMKADTPSFESWSPPFRRWVLIRPAALPVVLNSRLFALHATGHVVLDISDLTFRGHRFCPSSSHLIFYIFYRFVQTRLIAKFESDIVNDSVSINHHARATIPFCYRETLTQFQSPSYHWCMVDTYLSVRSTHTPLASMILKQSASCGLPLLSQTVSVIC